MQGRGRSCNFTKGIETFIVRKPRRCATFDSPSKDVADMGFAVGRRWTIIKGILVCILVELDLLFKNLVILPIFEDLFFPLYKVQGVVNFTVHVASYVPSVLGP